MGTAGKDHRGVVGDCGWSWGISRKWLMSGTWFLFCLPLWCWELACIYSYDGFCSVVVQVVELVIAQQSGRRGEKMWSWGRFWLERNPAGEKSYNVNIRSANCDLTVFSTEFGSYHACPARFLSIWNLDCASPFPSPCLLSNAKFNSLDLGWMKSSWRGPKLSCY